MARSSKSSNGSTKQSENAKSTEPDQETGADVDSESVESGEVETTAGEAGSYDEFAADTVETQEVTSEEPTEDAGDVTAVQNDMPLPPQPAPAPRSVAFGTILGGLVAGAIGFLVATLAVPEGWPSPRSADMDEIEAALAGQGSRIENLSAEMAVVRSAAPAASGTDVTSLDERIAAVETQINDILTTLDESLAGLDARISDFDARLSELDSRPSFPAGADETAAMELRLEEFRNQLDAVTADAQARIAEAQTRTAAIEAEAAATRAAAERAAALSSLRVALDNGTPFSDALTALPTASDALVAQAESGVPTQSGLQADFPMAARNALSKVQTVPDDASPGDRVIAFLKRRTNARSLSPRQGDDADAVLSRAEAALGNGDLGAALSELDALPEAARDAMADWVAAAETRAAALNAFAALASRTN